MRFFIHAHIMPWEIDELLVLVRKLKKSYYYLDKDDECTFYVCLNLSSAIVDWDKSKLEKKFFIDKFNSILQILNNSYSIECEIYEGDDPIGHLDTEKKLYKRHEEYDGVLVLCPDVHFHNTLLYSMFSAFKIIENKFSIVTPQTHKLWDVTWDEMTNKYCKQFSHKDYRKIDVYDVELVTENNLDNISILPVTNNKWAGWFDLRSSEICRLFPPPESWTGFGPYDTYLMWLLHHNKREVSSFDFQQYVIENQVIGKYSNHNFKQFYKEYLAFKDVKLTQRKKYESEINWLVKMKLKELQEGDKTSE